MKNNHYLSFVPLIIVFILIVWLITWSFNKGNSSDEGGLVLNSRLLENIEATKNILFIDFPGTLNYSSVLFYRNNEIDSVAITNAPIAYSPYYHFIGYIVKENTVYSFGWGLKNPEQKPDYNNVVNTSELCADEDLYYKIVYEDAKGSSYCGDVIFCYYDL